MKSLIVGGIAADNCVLFTAHDACVRGYELWIPGDCVVSQDDADRRLALRHAARVLKAKVAPAGRAP